jgi:hypothetical protein
VANYRDDLALQKRRDKRAAHQYLQGKQCYQTSLSDYLDAAQDRRWCMPEDVPCDVCGVAHQHVIDPVEKVEQDTAHTGLQLIQQEQLRAHTELAQYRLDLASVKGICLLCRAVKLGFEERSRARQQHERRGRKWLQPYTSCFWCLNLQSICQQAELGAKGGRDCKHRDVVLPLCFRVFESVEGPEWLQEQFDRQFDNIEDYFDWLGEESQFRGSSTIQAVRVTGLALRSI